MRAASKFERMAMARYRCGREKPPYARSHTRRPTTAIGARGETESSETQVMTYPYCVGILKHSPPTIYHGQGLA